MKQIRVAIFDLDNTLYDWYAAFLPAFYAMVNEASDILDCDKGQLLDQLQTVHVKHHDVEHPFSLMETPIVRTAICQQGEEQTWKLLDPAFYAFNKVRKSRLALFPGTLITLTELRERGVRIVAFTDSKYYAALGRVDRLGLAEYFTQIYCRRRSETSRLRRSEPEGYAAFAAKVTELPANETKPDPKVLVDIASRENITIETMAYIGDSIAKDVLMAKRAGCFAIWAKYGATVEKKLYDDLVRISHWTEEDILREKKYAAEANRIAPDFICEKSIAEVLNILSGTNLKSSTAARSVR